MNSLWQVFLLAMTPVGELRAAIPVCLTVFHLNWLSCYLISLAGNLVPVIFLLLFLEPISKYFSQKFKICNSFFNWLFKRTRKRYHQSRIKYGYLALIFFVALPLPVTGGWTGSIIAFLFDIPFKIAFPLIALGIGTAGVVVTFATIFGLVLSKYSGWQALMVTVTVGIIIWLVYNRLKKQKGWRNKKKK